MRCTISYLCMFHAQYELKFIDSSQAFPFDPNPNWSHFYSTGKEIHEYILSTTKKWNLDRDVKLNHRVLEALWQEDIGQWKCTIQHGDRQWVEHTDVLISGQGILK